MSREVYEGVAKTIRDTPFSNEDDLISLCVKLAKWFRANNRNFRPFKFFVACGLGGSLADELEKEVVGE